jgi:hypothetical protein
MCDHKSQDFEQIGFKAFISSVMFSSTWPILAPSSNITETTTAPTLDCSIIEFAAHVIEYFEEPNPSRVACMNSLWIAGLVY